ncbi:hypothetical protein [Paracoccus yeei]|uniref:hypothetical protein n=1 Tax=Paracoccus yeei TaxID=147645 RepID=UPI003BF8C302
MTRAIAKLLTKAEAALAEARRRARSDPLAGLSPAWRAFVERWTQERSLEDVYRALRDGTHPLSTVNNYEIPEDITSQQLAELWEKVRDS